MKTAILGTSALLLITIGASDALASRDYFSHNRINNDQRQHQKQYQGQKQSSSSRATGGNAISGATGGDAAGFGGSADNQVNIGGDSTDFNLPVSSAFAPPAFVNAPCGRTFGLAGQGVTTAWSFGLPLPNSTDCEYNNDSNWLSSIGNYNAAIKSRCMTKSMYRTFGVRGDSRNARRLACYQALQSLDRSITVLPLRLLEKRLDDQDTKIERIFLKSQTK